MSRISLAAVLLALLSHPSVGYSRPPESAESLARQAVTALVKAHNDQSLAGVLEMVRTPFLMGMEMVAVQSFGDLPRAVLLGTEDQLRSEWKAHFAHKLDTSILRVERYADYRKKHLAAVPDGLSEFSKRGFLARRRAMDEAVGKEGFIVFLGRQGKEAAVSEGVLVRVERGRAKVVGFSSHGLAWLNGWERK